jgi:flagellar biosynthesis protein FliR
MQALIDPNALVAVLLVATRIGALMVLSPIWTSIAAPAQVRVLWIMALSALLLAGGADVAVGTWGATATQPLSAGRVLMAMANEVLTGAVMAFGVFAAWAAVQTAARLLDLQMGLGVAAVFDPITRTQTPALVTLFNMLAVALFFAVDGHHALVRGIAYSLQQVPVGTGIALNLPEIVRQAGVSLSLALALVAPVFVALLLLDVALFVVSRVLPQMNLIVMSVPIKVALAFALLAALAPALGEPMRRVHYSIFAFWQAAL